MKLETRFLEIEKRLTFPKNGCWIYHGYKKQRYGIVRFDKKYRTIHKVFYEMLNGPVPKGLVLDHTCRNRACINLDHLEPVTNKVNILRGKGAGARNARKVKCKNGHYFLGKNLWISKTGFRHCRKCLTIRQKKWANKCEK